MRARIVGVAVLATGCVDLGPYRCDELDDCRRGEVVGVCEPTGYCSYPDEDCPSGRRYSDLAGALADDCVAQDSTGTTSTGGTTSSASSSTDGGTIPARCGDGNVDPGEACDDENEIDGDSCNRDCFLPRVPDWEDVVPGGVDEHEELRGVALLPSGDIVATGNAVVAGDREGLVVHWDPQGQWVTSTYVALSPVGVEDFVDAVALRNGGSLILAGRAQFDGAGAWLAYYDIVDHALVEPVVPLAYVPPDAVVHDDVGVVVVGGSYHEARSWAQTFNFELTPQGEPFAEQTSGQDDGLYGVDTDFTATRRLAAAQREGRAALLQLDPGAFTPLWLHDRTSRAQDLVIGHGRIVVGGHESGEASVAAMLQVFALDMTPQWSWSFDLTPTEVGDEVEAVAMDPAGNVIAVGFVGLAAQDARVWTFAPDGAPAWSWGWVDPLPGDDAARDIAVDDEGGFVVVGERRGDADDLDGWIVRFAP